MAIEEIKTHRGTISVHSKAPPKNSNAVEKTDFSLTLSGVKPPVERRAVERTDSVVFTNALTQMRGKFELSSSADSPVDVERAAKLERLKTAIAEGSYQPNPDRIAFNMIQDAILWG